MAKPPSKANRSLFDPSKSPNICPSDTPIKSNIRRSPRLKTEFSEFPASTPQLPRKTLPIYVEDGEKRAEVPGFWGRFGDECSALKKLAIRIISQTSSASGCERNWSVFQHIHSKKRNRLEHKRLNDLVYVRYNMRLRQRQLESTSARRHHTQYDPINIDHFDVLDSWVEDEPSAVLDDDDLDFLNVEGAAELIEGEGETSNQWDVGDIPFASEGIEATHEEEEEEDDDD